MRLPALAIALNIMRRNTCQAKTKLSMSKANFGHIHIAVTLTHSVVYCLSIMAVFWSFSTSPDLFFSSSSAFALFAKICK